MKKIFFCCLILLLPTVTLAESFDRIKAKVGTEIITISDTIESLRLKKKLLLLKYGKTQGTTLGQALEKNFLNELILEMILKEKIREEGLLLSNKEVETSYQNQLQALRKSEKEFLNELQSHGISLKEYKEDLSFELSRQKFLQKKITPKISVESADLQKSYEVRKNEFMSYNQFRFIEVALYRGDFQNEDQFKTVAGQIHKALKASSPEASKLIRQYSQGGFKDKGGDSGMMNGKDINPEIKMLLNYLKDGETSEIFFNPQAAYIFKLVQKSDPKPLPFAEAAGTLKMQLAKTAIDEELKRYLTAEKDKMFIEILDSKP